MSARRLNLPLSQEDISGLKLGEIVLLNGHIVTGRDRVHKFLYNEKPDPKDMPFKLDGLVLYHCGPIIVEKEGGYEVVAAGPTTSNRVEMYEPWVIKHYGLRGIMGKGGMGRGTLDAMREEGCVYLSAIGGAAVLLAERITAVKDVWMKNEFGAPEAMWLFEVKDFPAVVSIDANGNSLHVSIEDESRERLKKLIAR